MTTTKLFSLTITALVALASTVWAGPHGGGGGFAMGHAGGGFAVGRPGSFTGSHFGAAPVGSFNGGSIRAGPTFSGGARFIGNRNPGGSNRSPQQFSYYRAAPRAAVLPGASARRLPNRSVRSNAGAVATTDRKSNRMTSGEGQKRVTNPRLSTAENRQAFMKNHAFARHDSNWHRNWDKHHAHFDRGHVFVFVGGFWWVNPSDYYPYYGYGYPYNYGENSYPYDYSYDYEGYPNNTYEYSSSQSYSFYNDYAPSGQYSNAVVRAVQSQLSSLGYYHGAIDGVLGDQTEAALARYQQDQDLSVTGTVNGATLHALGLPYSGS